MKKQLLLSLFNQATTSAFQFLLSLYMIKLWTPELFGLFSIIFALGLILVGVQNAMFNTPYSVLKAAHQSTGNWMKLESSLSFFNTLFVTIVTIITLITVYYVSLLSPYLVISVTLYFLFLLIKEFYKNIAIVNNMVQWVAIVELYSILAIVVLSVIYVYTGENVVLNLNEILFIIGFSNLGVAILLTLKLKLKIKLSDLTFKDYLDTYKTFVWQDSRWSFVGMITTELQNRGYIFIVSILLGTTSVGLIQAARVFFGPLNLLTGAWGRIVRPQLAVLYQTEESNKMKKVLFYSLAGFILFNLCFSLVLWCLWPYLKTVMFSQNYENIGYIVICWSIATLLLHIRNVFSITAQAIFQFKSLAFSTVIGAIFTLVLTTFFSLNGMADSVIVAIIFGEILATCYIIKFTLKPLKIRFSK
jgi:O-antigen/teichoic acid export membrane protein